MRSMLALAALKEGQTMRSVCMISAIAVVAFAASASAQQGDQKLRQAIEEIAAQYQDAENKSDAAAIPGFFTKDGEVVAAFSEPLVKSGPPAIQKFYEDAFKAIKDRHIEIKVDQVSPMGNDAALGVGHWHITGEGQNGSAMKLDGFFTTVYADTGGTWKIRMLTVFTPPPTPPAPPPK
jgi:uncharacterized protein (TIGR02246 family)